MDNTTQEPGRSSRTHLRVVRDGESGHGDFSSVEDTVGEESLKDRLMQMSSLLEEYDGENPEKLYAAGFDVARQIFIEATVDWSERERETVGSFDQLLTSNLSYEFNMGRSVIESTSVVIDSVLEDESIAEIMSHRNMRVAVSEQKFRELLFVALQSQIAARDMVLMMSACVRDGRGCDSTSEQTDIKQMMLDYQYQHLSNERLDALFRFMIGYSRIVVEGHARAMGYSDDIAKKLAQVIALDKLNGIVTVDLDDSQHIEEVCDGWVRQELKAIADQMKQSGGKPE